ncbi:oligopeptide transporter 1-like [Spinacia oleracea]|uniref:Oligopeptide transporter 1-like n=1 Tax=Spinacia oleracea TaxID=3562 RepID=A0A9R0K2T9_SPIOL|nr:oligopeptide transporter 1-like [Spinacia oleracea]
MGFEVGSTSYSKDPENNHSSFQIDTGGEEINDNPIEEVRLTVPITDDPTLPALTFRTWVLGLFSCILLAFINRFFGFRQNPLSVSSVAAQIAVTPIGRLMASTLPTKQIIIPFTNWSFSMNPGPFNLKEHVLITIFASCGASGVYATRIITIVKAFYKREMNPVAAILLALTTQLLGYGWAGLFRKYLVDSPYMWWPSNLVQVSLFRTLHENDVRIKGGLTRLQFFLMVIGTSFAYYVIPGYLFPSIGCLSILCWLWKKSIFMQQMGSGLHGLGIGAVSLDWNTVISFLGSPLSTPSSAIMNIMAGFFLVAYFVVPAAYYSNSYEAKRFPFISTKTFDYSGHQYNISRVMNENTFTLDDGSYDSYGKLYLSIFFAFAYGLSFATLSAMISHVALFHGKSIWRMWTQTTSGISGEFSDVHSRLMKKNYAQVPQWWYHILLAVTFGLALLACEGFSKQLQLPWWGLLMACGISAFFTLPIGIINATTNIQPGLNVITELIIGYIYPGRPLANVTFKTYGYISMAQALWLLQDFKLGHYMKIPPRSMFIVQLVGTIVASLVYFGTTWWLLSTVENMCDASLLPEGSPWTCPDEEVFYNASIIWGVIGPGKMFTNRGNYPQLNWFFLIGFLAPFPGWLLSRKYPEIKLFKLINTPVIISATMMMPPARSINYLTWGAVGIFFNYYVYRAYKGWWAKYNYILSAGLEAGIAFMGILLYFSLQNKDIFGIQWWGLQQDDYCPLAKCPTMAGVQVQGCPVFR